MKKTSVNLSGVKKPTQEAEWENAEESWKITAREVRQRVRTLRDELECYRDLLEGAPFGIACGFYDPSPSLDRRKFVGNLVENLNPLVKGLFNRIDNYARDHGTHESVDFNAKLFALETETAESGFGIGVLLGVILAGCSKEQIDRFERGLSISPGFKAYACKRVTP